MDVVKTAVQSLGGSLTITAEAGSGTCFQLILPLTIAIINVLLVKSGGGTFAVPLTAVNRTMELQNDEIASIDNRAAFFLNGETVPLLSLSRLLDPAGGETEYAATTQLLLTEVNGRVMAVQVDSLLGSREIFVKPLGRPLSSLRGLSGATVSGDGEVVFILDIPSRLQ
jgi:two-component system chemotaxis sensor kinase CheA